MDAEVFRQIVAEGGCSGPNRRTVVNLGWSADDPLAVHLNVSAEPDHPALPRGEWAVLRDYLAYGCERVTGDGDVRMRPDPTRTKVVFELTREGRTCRLTMPAEPLRDFLAETEAAVPLGKERPDVVVDEVLARLLRTPHPQSP